MNRSSVFALLCLLGSAAGCKAASEPSLAREVRCLRMLTVAAECQRVIAQSEGTAWAERDNYIKAAEPLLAWARGLNPAAGGDVPKLPDFEPGIKVLPHFHPPIPPPAEDLCGCEAVYAATIQECSSVADTCFMRAEIRKALCELHCPRQP